jgi:hypothetical protein
MTSEEYAEAVRKTILDARDARMLYEDDHQLKWAYKELADCSPKRCLDQGRQYEVDSDTQRFEKRSVFDAIVECRAEAFDIPAYLSQVELLTGIHADPEIREGVDLAARLILLLDRLTTRLDADGYGNG